MAKLSLFAGLFSIFFLLQKAKALVATHWSRGSGSREPSGCRSAAFVLRLITQMKSRRLQPAAFVYFKFLVLTMNSHEKAAIQISPTIFALRIWSVR